MVSFGNPTTEKRALQSLYEDTCTISRTVDVKPDGSNITRKEEQEVYTGILCGLSFSGSNSSAQREHAHLIDWDAKLFVDPELQIYPGDKVTVSRLSGRETYRYQVIGKPAIYATHQEVKVVEEDLS